MAERPDSDRHFETDPEPGGGEGGRRDDPPYSRMGLSSWAIAVVVVLVTAGLILLLS